MSEAVTRLTLELVARNLTAGGISAASASLTKASAEAKRQADQQVAAARKAAAQQEESARGVANAMLRITQQAAAQQIRQMQQDGAEQARILTKAIASATGPRKAALDQQLFDLRQNVTLQTDAIRVAAADQLAVVRDNTHKEIAALHEARDAQIRAANEARDASIATAQQTAGRRTAILHKAAGLAMGAAFVAPMVAGAVAASVKAAISFQGDTQALSNNTNMGAAGLAAMRANALALAPKTGMDPTQIAEGYMRIANHAYAGAAATNILTAATKNAAATNGDAAENANILAGVLREYNVQAPLLASNTGLATRYMDVLHNAVANSNFTMNDFTEGSKRAIATAGNFGVPLSQVTAQLAVLSEHGFPSASVASQNWAGMLRSLEGPTAKGLKGMAALSLATGVDLVGDIKKLQQNGAFLPQFLADIQTATGGDFNKIRAIMPQSSYATALMAVVRNHEQLGKVQTLTGAAEQGRKAPGMVGTNEAFAAQQRTVQGQLKDLQQTAHVAAITLGTALLPAVTHVAQALSGALQAGMAAAQRVMTAIQHPTQAWRQALSSLGTLLHTTVSTIGTILAPVGQLAGGIGHATGQVGSLTQHLIPSTGAMQTLGRVVAIVGGLILGYKAAVAGITLATKLWTVATEVMTIAQRALNLAMRANLLGIVITAVAALALGFIYLYNHSKTFHDFIQRVWSWMAGTLGPGLHAIANIVGHVLGAAWQQAVSDAQVWWDRLTALWTWLSGVFVPIFTTIGDAIKNFLGGAFDFVKDKITGFLGVLGSVLNALSHIPGVGGAAKAALDGLKALASDDHPASTAARHTAAAHRMFGPPIPPGAHPTQHLLALHLGHLGQGNPLAAHPAVVAAHHTLSAAAAARDRLLVNKPAHERSPEQNLQLDLRTLMARFRGQTGADVGDVAKMQALIGKITLLDPKQGALLTTQLNVAVQHRDQAIARHQQTVAHHQQVLQHHKVVQDLAAQITLSRDHLQALLKQGDDAAAARERANFIALDTQKYLQQGQAPAMARQLAEAEGKKIGTGQLVLQGGFANRPTGLAALLRSERDTALSFGTSDASFFGRGKDSGLAEENNRLKQQLANADKQLAATQQSNTLLQQQLTALKALVPHAAQTAASVGTVAASVSKPRLTFGQQLAGAGIGGW
jgi:TP901 family phage tail tape measure protein